MKRNILFRLLSIILFGLPWIVMRSESSCYNKLNCEAKKSAQSQRFMLDEKIEIPVFPLDEGFLMKI